MKISTQHFNGLSEAKQERLVVLAEECSEVIQAVSKILRHGYESRNPVLEGSETNQEMLERECGDVFYAVRQLTAVADINMARCEDQMFEKLSKSRKYLHHQ